MKTFDPLPGEGSIREWLKRFVPKLERELRRLDRKTPAKALSAEEIRKALLDDPDFKDSIYRYIMERQAKEEA